MTDVKTGETLFAEGKVEEAEKCFLDLLKKDPSNTEALNDLGVIQHAKGNVKGAEDLFLKAIAAKQEYLDARLNLVDLYQDAKRWSEAAIQLEKFISICNHDHNVFNQLGLIYLEMDDTVKAQVALKKSLELNPEQKTVRDSLNALQIQNPVELASRDQISEDYSNHHLSNTELPKTDNLRKKPKAPRVSRNGRPTVCVGLPVYNGGRLLSQAIESILSQDFENIQLIISDNCSTDNTEEICLKYQKMDKRVHYYRLEENLGASKNFLNVFGLSNAPYYMWASHDDLRERSFISKCLEKIESDPSIALVYPQTKVLDANSRFLGIANDHLNTDQDNPIERFRHLIWEIGMCNMFYGLYRTNIIKKVRSWGKTLFGDNLMLAEIALLGKIVQINDALFVRRLTRNYNYRSPDERNAQLISDIDTNLFHEGITLPHCRFTYANLELVNYSEIQESEKEFLINDVLKCFKIRFGDKMKYEISRAVELITNGYFYYTWDKKRSHTDHSGNLRIIDYFHINNLLKHLQEALFIFPERTDLKDAYEICLRKASDCKAVLA
ncbi:MAG TPA: glycosyltransferase [Desulfatiglandales bacterium]|nr:glycosyltransferase [Desulfatiglandales bacterium]